MQNENKWLPRKGTIIGLVAAVVVFLVVGLPVLMFTLQSGSCSGMPAPCLDESPALNIALFAIATTCLATWWTVKRAFHSSEQPEDDA